MLSLLPLFLFIIPLLCWALIPYVYQRRQTAGATSLMIILLTIGWWGICYAAELWVGDNLAAKLFWKTIKYAGIVIVPVFWLTFSLAYANTSAAVRRRTLRLLLIIPTITFLLILTNEWHHFVWDNVRLVRTGFFVTVATDNQFWFWIHTAYSYILLLLGTIILVRRLWFLPRLYRRQAIILLGALLPPWVSNIASLLGIVPIPELDLTPLAFAITALLLVWGFTRLQILDIAPIARQLVIEHMPSGMLVVDQQQRIVDLNPAAREMLGLSQEVVGQPIADVLAGLAPFLNRDVSAAPVETEIALDTAAGQKQYLTRIVPLPNAQGDINGRLLTLLDITARKEMEQALHQQSEQARKLALVASRTSNMVIITDAEGYIEWVNEGFVRTTGYTLSEIVGRKPGSFLQGERTSPKAVQEMRAKVAQQQGFYTELINYNKQGQAYWVSIEAQPVYDHNDRLTNFIAIESDITERKQMEESLRQSEAQARLSAQNQTIVYQLLRIISGELDPNAVMQRAVQIIAQSTGWPKVAILLPTAAGTSLEVNALYSTDNHTAAYDPLLLGLAREAFTEQKPISQPDITAVSEINPPIAGLHNQLAVPLKWGIKVSGVLAIENHPNQQFTAADVRLAESFTDALVIGLNNARLYNELDKYLLELSITQSITQTATESLVLEELLQETLIVTVSSLEFEGGFIVLKSPETGAVEVVTSNRMIASVQALLINPSFRSALADYLDTGQSMVWQADEPSNPQAAGQALHRYWRQADLSMCATSFLVYRNNPLGMIVLFTTHPAKYTVPTPLIQSIGPQIATAVANARLYKTITQQHSQLNTLIAATRDGIMLIEQNGRIGVLNEAAHKLLRLSQTTDDWIGQPFAAALLALRHTAPQAIRTLLREMRIPLDYDNPLRTGELEIAPRILQWTEVLVIDDHTTLGRLFVFRDITEEKQLIQMRDDLTNTIVHDMRNPVTGIKVAVEMLQRMVDKDAADQVMLLDAAQESSEHLIKLINSLLDVSRLESGRMPLNQQFISVYDIAERVVQLEKVLADNKQLTLNNAIPLDLPAAYADYSLIERVMQNLVGNAIKFTPNNGRIEIRAEPYTADKLLVTICDNGPGIEPALRDSLFQKFTTGRHENRGSGLGLAFCRLAVEAHGGRIWVESEVGQGTEFKFTLPAEPV